MSLRRAPGHRFERHLRLVLKYRVGKRCEATTDQFTEGFAMPRRAIPTKSLPTAPPRTRAPSIPRCRIAGANDQSIPRKAILGLIGARQSPHMPLGVRQNGRLLLMDPQPNSNGFASKREIIDGIEYLLFIQEQGICSPTSRSCGVFRLPLPQSGNAKPTPLHSRDQWLNESDSDMWEWAMETARQDAKANPKK